jgi:DNA-binding beta-propeller fold protein YncE
MNSHCNFAFFAGVVLGITVAFGEPAPGLRRPVALDSVGDRLLVANQASGTVSLLDPSSRAVIGESKIGAKLSDLAILAATHHFLATDEEAGRLIAGSVSGTNILAGQSLYIGAAPVSIQISEDGKMCFVALLWGRAIAFVQVASLGGELQLQLLKSVRLPFAPRRQLLSGSNLIVADAFGGNIALLDKETRTVKSVRPLPAHNIRGLALNRDRTRVYVTHQTLSPLAHTTVDDIRWGNLIGNHLRSLSVQNVLNPKAFLLEDAQLYPLGELDHGFADPGPIAVTPDGEVFIASSGTGKILHRAESTAEFARVDVGRRLTDFALSRDQRHLYAADTAADEIAIIDTSAASIIDRISLGPQRARTPAEQGEELFFDARVSHKGWLSCHSCHTDGHSNELLSDTLGDGSFGAPKRVLSLLGTGDTGPWAWNGSAATLEDQIHKSIISTMRGAPPSEKHVTALAAYLRTLDPPPRAAADPSSRADSVTRGEQLFTRLGCVKCHESPAFTTPRVYHIPLADENGKTRFNPPSLRGLSQRTVFLHDNRARHLAAVFTEVRHGLAGPLAESELAELIAFLETL